MSCLWNPFTAKTQPERKSRSSIKNRNRAGNSGRKRSISFDTGIIIRILVAAVLAVIYGNGSVVCFNRMDARWFLDYEDENGHGDASHGHFGGSDGPGDPDGRPRRVLPQKLLEADNAGRQRLPSSPWKYAFTGYFAISGLYLAIRGGSLSYEIAVLSVFFVVLEMAISDQLYQIVPDQLSIALAVLAVAFLGYHEKWWEPLAGAALGFAVSAAILALGLLIFRTGSIGGADIKFFTCMGLVTGRTGIVIIFILTTLLFALYSLIKIAGGRGTIKDRNAMLPSAAAAVTVYFLFLFSTEGILTMEL